MTELSVILPIYNENPRLRASIAHVAEYLDAHFPDHEIIAVDDGSSDGSGELLDALEQTIPGLKSIRYAPNQGKGMALRQGIEAATGEWIVTLDADLELPIEMLPRFFEAQQAAKAHVVVGSKRHPESVVRYPLARRWLSRGYGLVIRTLFDLPLSDTQVGFKLFHRQAVRGTVAWLLVKRFAFDVEVLAVQHRMGNRLAEAPIRLDFSRPGTGRIRVSTILNIVRETAGIWYRMYITHYYDRAVDSVESDVREPMSLYASRG